MGFLLINLLFFNVVDEETDKQNVFWWYALIWILYFLCLPFLTEYFLDWKQVLIWRFLQISAQQAANPFRFSSFFKY